MKKMMVLFWTLLLFPTLALASGDMVSISELRQQVEAMGRWTKTYEAYGEGSYFIGSPRSPVSELDGDRTFDEKRMLGRICNL